jgi:hypothetical protein
MLTGGSLVGVDLSAPLAQTLAALLAEGAAALGVPAPSPLRAALALVAATATLLGLATLRPSLLRSALPHLAWPRLAWPRLAWPRPAWRHQAGPSRGASAPAHGDNRFERLRAMAAEGHPAAEIARATGLARDAVAMALHLAV